MIRKIFVFIFKILGWKLQTEAIKEFKKSIVIAAPHTANMDLVIARAAFDLMHLPVKFTVKKEWIRFPFKSIMLGMGGIGIDRTPKKPGDPRPSMVEAMVNLFNENDELHIMVTPEGTRSKRTEWKTGFWHTAKMANVPILLGYLDYKNKVAGIGKIIYPTDLEKDMRTMMEFYKDITPCHPEKFSVDLRYSS
ncbi:MAG: 1-acyl-sn-glycerol-3-phosphate acyltransferase [Chitinophagales bacterium]|nr:1-acyl-sn-glycerol-3-phosphate acyltransferase [Bacteroidota bacterium]